MALLSSALQLAGPCHTVHSVSHCVPPCPGLCPPSNCCLSQNNQVAAANGEVIITNDGATILNKMTVAHPAAKMLVELAKSQVSGQDPFQILPANPLKTSFRPPSGPLRAVYTCPPTHPPTGGPGSNPAHSKNWVPSL